MNSQRFGILYAILAYGFWGLFPIYWKFLDSIPVLLLGILLAANFGKSSIGLLVTPRQSLPLLASASILAFNWGLYIYGVNSDRIVETSLGYFINPLVNVLLGVIILHERLRWGQWLAVMLATIGVNYSIFAVGQVPWV